MKDLESELEGLIGPPIEVGDDLIQACRQRNEFGGLTFDLHKEATGLVCVIGSLYLSNDGGEPQLTRNQAVCVGLLVRISKLMVSVTKLSSGEEHGETVQILNRCVIESCVNLQFILKRDEERLYERFVKAGLTGERELYDIINSNIEARGGQILAIEADMLASILGTCENSGVKIEDIDPKAREWGGNYRDKLKVIGIEESYGILQGVTSQSVHGSWSDLITNHLDANGPGYQPRYDHRHTDGVLLGPMAFFAVDAARAYIDRFFDPDETEPIRSRLDSLRGRLLKVETSRQGWELTHHGA